MKLLTKTNLNFLSLSLFLFMAGSFFYYFMVRATINKNLNKELIEFQNKILSDYQAGTSFATKTNSLYYINYSIDTISHSQTEETTFSDTTIYDEKTKKYQLFRKLNTTVLVNGKNIKFRFMKSHRNTDSIISDLALLMTIMTLFFLSSLFIMNRYAIKSSWLSFYNTINKLKDFDINKGNGLQFEEVEIEEFNNLNSVLADITKKIQTDFENLKEYTENTSHEIQTPLAIINSNVELLLQTGNLLEKQLEHISKIYEAGRRLSKLNNSLIYLAKLDKRQFIETIEVDLKNLIEKNIRFFEDYIESKEIKLDFIIIENVILKLNKDLADTLIQNLLKNSIKHNTKAGEISITLNKNNLIISNTSNYSAGDTTEFFERFKKKDYYTKSPGIGLSIVKRICEIFEMKITYNCVEKIHTITLYF